ncbi:MAG: VTC domain-containing protein [Blastocatellia bacterium]
MLRYEYKYIVGYERLARLRALLAPHMAVDAFAQLSGGEYTVRNIYFDTPAMDCYFQKINGVKRRDKLRLRGYNDGGPDAPVFFEVKEKVDEPLRKHRASLRYDAAQAVLAGKSLDDVAITPGRNGDAREQARMFMYKMHTRRMRPVVRVVYDREPFEEIFPDPDNDLRVTFDKNLRSAPLPQPDALFAESVMEPVMSGNFILEIKFNQRMPAWIATLVKSLGLTRESASKYAMCIEAHPEITAGIDTRAAIQSMDSPPAV